MSDVVLSRGFRFHPSDEELLTEYLMPKTISPDNFRCCFIKKMNLFDSEPWRLPHVRDPFFGEREWYYFAEKNPSGHECLWKEGSVPTSHGWRKLSVEETITDKKEEGTIIGRKSKYLFLVCNPSNNQQRAATGWSMTEYKLSEAEQWVICHVVYTHWKNDTVYTHWKDGIDDLRYGGVEHPALEWQLVKECIQSLTIPPNRDSYGFRFHPTDKELVTTFLVPKNLSSPFPCFIKELDLFSKEPWLMDLERSPFYREKEWYYFVKKACDKCEEQNLRFSLDGKQKQWRINGQLSNVEEDEASKRVIGTKTVFSFNLCNSVHRRSGWKVEVYALPPRSRGKWALCKLLYVGSGSKYPPRQTPRDLPHPKLQYDVLKNLHETNVSD